MSDPFAGTVVVTGGAGVLGEAVLRELSDVPVVALRYRRPIAEGSQLEVVDGDVTAPNLGLSPAAYAQLRARATCVVHSAAATGYAASQRTLAAVNVDGTERALQLAVDAGALFVHIGTALEPEALGAGGPARRRVTLDRYLHSKRAADALVATSSHQALRVRPSLISGNAATGETPGFQGLYALARHLLDGDVPILPLPPDARIDFLPRDDVARALRFALETGWHSGELWLTAGAEALPAETALDVMVATAEAHGVPFATPRIVDAEAMERLIRPVLLPALPQRTQRRFAYLWDLMRPLLGNVQPPSALPALRARGLDLPLDLARALASSIAFWMRTNRADARVHG
ncbi:MAG: SDR family oxidoreductase [Conexibacter sp.]